MEYKLYEVFKHPNPAQGQNWAVQFPRGIICYRLKKSALEIAASMKRKDEERVNR